MRTFWTILLALAVGVMLTAAPCVDCVAKVTHGPHRCCGKTRPEPKTDHQCANEVQTTAAEAKTIDSAPVTIAVLEAPIAVEPRIIETASVAVAPPAEGPPVFLSLESLLC